MRTYIYSVNSTNVNFSGAFGFNGALHFACIGERLETKVELISVTFYGERKFSPAKVRAVTSRMLSICSKS